MIRPLALLGAFAAALFGAGCRDLDRFSTGDGRFEGSVISAEFVRTGVDGGTRLCMTLDTERLETAPGTLTTSDGRFRGATLRPIPAVLHDPLSTLSFGSGRTKNLLFGARTASEPASDLLVVVSLLDSGGAEVRLLRPDGADGASGVFAVFPLEKADGPCSFETP